MSDAQTIHRLKQRAGEEYRRRQEIRALSLESETDLSLFSQLAWRHIDPAPYVHNWHIDAIAEHLEAVTHGHITRLLINIPPRCDKSTLVSVTWPAWIWAQDRRGPLSGPQVGVLAASYAHTLSLRDSVKTRRLISSPWYQRQWGNRFKLTGDQNTKIRFDNDKGGYRIATSVDGALTGEGGDIVIVDDPHNTVEIESEAIRQSVLDWWGQSMSTRLNDPKTGAMVVVMQRLHEDDLSGHILNQGGWEHLMLPMRYDASRAFVTGLGFQDPRTEDGELLWPERFGEREVKGLEAALGSYGAAGQLQQSPLPKGGGIFKREWWKLYPEGGEALDAEGKPVKPLAFPPLNYIIASVDTAFTTKAENDWSALTVWGAWNGPNESPRLMLMDAWRVRLEFHDLVEKIIATCRKRKVDRLIIEPKANGISVAQEIHRLCEREEFGVTMLDPKAKDKVARAYAVQHLWESGIVWAPDRKYADLVIDEMASFPKGKHDDLVDTCTMAARHLRDIGWGLTNEEAADEMARSMAPPRRKVPVYDV